MVAITVRCWFVDDGSRFITDDLERFVASS
jgi:hypothetical protein